ncbi:MAG: hypothetical protein HN849_12620 [Victivallales bacterium]|nr:hypothetical protein [Victivallales bacterium]MBT7300356.1 hypothetical protein [Victivallales bacterium]
MKMTPKERICAAMRREEVDYLPCSIYFNGNLTVAGRSCARLADRTELALALGTDPVIGAGMPGGMHEEVAIRTWEEQVAGEEYPILWQAWDTPVGTLTQAVRKGLASANWKRIHWGDESASSLYKPLIETSEDVERFRFLMQPCTEERFTAWQRSSEPTFSYAKEHDLPVVCTYGQGLAALMFTMGAERAVYLAMDDPAGFEDLAETIHQAEMHKIELAARSHVNILKRFGGYEMCNFYNPEIYQRVCVPRLRREIELAHSLGLLIYYRVVTGMKPLLEAIAGLGFDCIEGGEPHLSQCSLAAWHTAFGGQAASWTGVSTPVLLGGGDPEAVRQEVRRCVEVFGCCGFILGVTNSIRQHFPWENTVAMIDEWKRVR